MHCTIRNTAVVMWADIKACNVGGYFSLLLGMQIDKISKTTYFPLKAFLFYNNTSNSLQKFSFSHLQSLISLTVPVTI